MVCLFITAEYYRFSLYKQRLAIFKVTAYLFNISFKTLVCEAKIIILMNEKEDRKDISV